MHLLGKTLNKYHAKCIHLSKMQNVLHCYTAVLYEPIPKLYMYKHSAVYLSDSARLMSFFFFFFRIEKPNYTEIYIWSTKVKGALQEQGRLKTIALFKSNFEQELYIEIYDGIN